MSYLVDTNVVSELRKKHRANPQVAAWFGQHVPHELFLSVLTISELRRGAARMRRRDPAAGKALDTWVTSVEDQYRGRLLPVDRTVAEKWGELGVQATIPVVDGLLAATALVHDLVVVTRNVRHIAPTGARCLDPFG